MRVFQKLRVISKEYHRSTGIHPWHEHTYCRTYILFRTYARRSRSVAVVTSPPRPPIATNPASSDTPAGSSERDRPFYTDEQRVRRCSFIIRSSQRRPPGVKSCGNETTAFGVLSSVTTVAIAVDDDPNNDDELGRESRSVGIRESHYCIGVRLVFLIVRRILSRRFRFGETTIIVCCPLPGQKKK